MIRMAERKEEEEEEEKTSECSSGCQSGWTMYLDQSYENLDSSAYHKATSIEEEEEEEDLSMVSDASSGPPHFHEEDHERYCCHCRSGCVCSASSLLRSHAYADNAGKKRRVEADTSLLNDTASSPFFSFSKTSCTTATTTTATNNKKKVAREELSCGFSATHFKARPAASVTRLHLGFLQSSTPAKPHSVCGEEGKKRLR